MQDNIHDDLDGEGMSLIKLPGWAAIGGVVFATILLAVFSIWADKVTNRAKAAGEVVGDVEDEEEEDDEEEIVDDDDESNSIEIGGLMATQGQ